MSSTQTQTATAEQTHPPEITVLSRVAAIPVISSSLVTINDALTNNSYTRHPYAQAKGLSISAYKLTEYIQVKFAPLIVRVDGYANKAVDVVESRYPYPFKAQPQEVVHYVLERKDRTISGVNRAIDDKVKTPALHVAQDIDQKFTPIVNIFEHAVSRFNPSDAPVSTPPDAKYQYQRALALSKTLKESLYDYSAEQLKHLQAQSVIAQKASETAHAIATVASSSMTTAHTKISSLSDNMIAGLGDLQRSASQLVASLQTNSAQGAQQIRHSYNDLSAALASTAHELGGIAGQKDLPIQEKIVRMSKEVQNRVNPLLETVKKGVAEVLGRSKGVVSSTNANGGSQANTK